MLLSSLNNICLHPNSDLKTELCMNWVWERKTSLFIGEAIVGGISKLLHCRNCMAVNSYKVFMHITNSVT